MDVVQKIIDENQRALESNFAGFELTVIANACGVTHQSVDAIASKLGCVPKITADSKKLFSVADFARFRSYYEGKRQRGELV